MKRKQRKIAVLAAVIVLAVSAFSAVYFVFLDGLIAPTDTSSPHYLTIQSSPSKIYLVSQSLSLSFANQTYTSSDGQQVAQGSRLYTINLTLRNDYSSENPPPSTGTPIAPIDGTAYLRLKSTLFNNGVTIPSINLSQSDFTTPSPDETTLVLASGQMNTVHLLLATNETKINDFAILLVSVSDSISS